MPLGDWQFWLVTLAAAGGVALLARVLLPRKPRAKRANLTISAGRRD